MSTSKEVFAKRREGAIDEAYEMAVQLTRSAEVSDWDFKALAWCLIDLIKRDAQSENKQNLARYRQQLESIQADSADDVLQKSVKNALMLCNPQGHLIAQAKLLGKQERHAEAADLYRKVYAGGGADRDIQTSLAWELYKSSKQLISLENFNLGQVKRNLNDYLKLDVEKPSLLHTCFLQLAVKVSGQAALNIIAFSRLWKLEYLRAEDFDRYRADDGKEYPSLAEKVIQQAGKEAAKSESAQDRKYILPHIDTAIGYFPDNIWLKLDKAKVLLALGLHDEALEFGLAVVKSKINDYWAWGLLGDICADKDSSAALNCYCKALLCPAEDKYTGKLRIKLAQLMVASNELSAAKHEIESVLRFREAEGQKIPEVAANIAKQGWYSETNQNQSNFNYYKLNSSAADELLFRNMPWINANSGSIFTVPGTEGRKEKVKRKLYISDPYFPVEVSIPESKFKFKNRTQGEGLRLKGEFDDRARFQVYLIEERDLGLRWDIFPETIGVVDHVNSNKRLIHFIVSRDIGGIVPFSELSENFREGDAISLRLSSYASEKGRAYHVVSAAATNKSPSSLVKKEFCEVVRLSNGMGFTENDIFVSPSLVEEYQIEDGRKLSGTALLSYNKKRSSWGWRASSIEYGRSNTIAE
jgi:hypothetical protein